MLPIRELVRLPWAVGIKTKNKSLGVGDSSGVAHANIIELVSLKGLATGLVSTSAITHATPAAFLVHINNRKQFDAIAMGFVNAPIDVIIGGGSQYFNQRADSLDLIKMLQNNGFSVYFNLKDAHPAAKLAVFGDENHMIPVYEGRGDMLPDATTLALESLSRNKKGFFLMVEGAQIDFAAGEKDINYLVDEVIDFDKSVGLAFDYADRNPGTLVIVTADHETGGLTIMDGCYATGTLEAEFSADSHTGIMVPVFAYGSGAEGFGGVYENTEIFYKILSFLEIRAD